MYDMWFPKKYHIGYINTSEGLNLARHVRERDRHTALLNRGSLHNALILHNSIP
jgi:hypothetical protein